MRMRLTVQKTLAHSLVTNVKTLHKNRSTRNRKPEPKIIVTSNNDIPFETLILKNWWPSITCYRKLTMSSNCLLFQESFKPLLQVLVYVFTIGDSSLLASGQESWMHGSQSFWLVERTFSIILLLLF